MADATLSTRVSRRSMLAAGVAVVALPLPRIAVLPTASGKGPAGEAVDAELLRRISAAHDCLATYRRADNSACDQLEHAQSSRSAFPDRMPSTQAEGERWDMLLEQNGIVAAYTHCEWLYERYEAALAAAFALPARTLAGVHGKLRLALTAVKQEQDGLLDPANCAYLDNTLGDLGHLTVERAPRVEAE